jgi:hypothetical protein
VCICRDVCVIAKYVLIIDRLGRGDEEVVEGKAGE